MRQSDLLCVRRCKQVNLIITYRHCQFEKFRIHSSPNNCWNQTASSTRLIHKLYKYKPSRINGYLESFCTAVLYSVVYWPDISIDEADSPMPLCSYQRERTYTTRLKMGYRTPLSLVTHVYGRDPRTKSDGLTQGQGHTKRTPINSIKLFLYQPQLPTIRTWKHDRNSVAEHLLDGVGGGGWGRGCDISIALSNLNWARLSMSLWVRATCADWRVHGNCKPLFENNGHLMVFRFTLNPRKISQ